MFTLASYSKLLSPAGNPVTDAAAFGGTVSVSRDMCHPNGANTHPETYPNYQVQVHTAALLRDMINWCIRHTTKGKPLAADDSKLRAM